MASMLAFYSDYLSLNPTEILIVSILLERGPDLSILKFIYFKLGHPMPLFCLFLIFPQIDETECPSNV